MKTRAIFLKALVIGGFVLSAANFSPEAQAATPLTTQNKSTLDAAGVSTVASSVTSMLAAAPAADREQLAKDIVVYLASKPGVNRNVLKNAVSAAIKQQLPGKAAGIAAAAAQAAVAGNPGTQEDLIKAIIQGAREGAPGELAAVQTALIAALPSLKDVIDAAIATPDAPVQPGVNNNTDTSTSAKS